MRKMMASSLLGARLALRFVAVDFDGTCTAAETTDLLPHLAAHHGPPEKAAFKLAAFRKFTEEYLEGLDRIMKENQLDEYASDTLDLDGLSSFLRQMDDHSSEVTMKVSESGCLADIRPEAVRDTLAQWSETPETAPIIPPKLRPGCASTLSFLASKGSGLGVLSINWSPALIDSILGAQLDQHYELWSNRINEDGRIQLIVQGAAEKRERIIELIEQAGDAGLVVYVGDSATDLLALLEANVGILIGESNTARRVARRFGVQIKPLPSSIVECGAQSNLDSRGVVFEATNWDEICRYLDETKL